MSTLAERIAALQAELNDLKHQEERLARQTDLVAAEMLRLADFSLSPEERVVAKREVRTVDPRLVRWSKGQDLEALFGYGTTVEDLSSCAHYLDTCECVREFLWSRKSPPEDRREVPLSSPNVCTHHAHLAGDMGRHHECIVVENVHKNCCYHEIVDLVPAKYNVRRVDPLTGAESQDLAVAPVLRFNADRELEVELPLAMRSDVAIKAKVQDHFDRTSVSRRVKVQ